MSAEALRDLAAALSPDSLIIDADVMESYRRDRALTAPHGRPIAVVRASDTAEVTSTLEVASAHRIPVVTRGAGSGLSGGASAVDGCIVLSTARMSGVRIDRANMFAVAQAGVLNATLKRAAAEHGLWYPPDPSSQDICTIGGNLATNAGGLCCVKYGVTTDYVLGVEVVLADGRVVRLGGPTVKDVAGYDLKRLVVGSEGTLGVITEATLRLRPAPPAKSTIAATFDDVVDAGRAVVAIMGELRPDTLELMDGTAVRAVEAAKPMGLDPTVGALLLAQVETTGPGVAAVTALCEVNGAQFVASTDDPDEGEMFMAARRMVLDCVERLGTVIIEDVGVPISRIPDLIVAVNDVAISLGMIIPIVGHAGDGNLHPLIVFDPMDPDRRTSAEIAYSRIMEATLALGGTISGEHGIGSLKSGQLHHQVGADVVALSRSVKRAFDPLGILNPGKWL